MLCSRARGGTGEEATQDAKFNAYFSVFSFIDYVDIDILKFTKAPRSFHGAEERWQVSGADKTGFFREPSAVCQFPLVKKHCPCKDVSKNLPSWAAALAAGTRDGQLRT